MACVKLGVDWFREFLGNDLELGCFAVHLHVRRLDKQWLHPLEPILRAH